MSWTFGIKGFDEEGVYGVVEKPLSYPTPSIFDESGDEVVGCAGYHVFNEKYVPLLLAAPDLLVALEDVLSAVEPLDSQGYHFVNKAKSLIEKVKGGLSDC